MKLVLFMICTVSAHLTNMTTVETPICSVQLDCPNPTFAKCDGGYCEHKDVFPPETTELIGVFILPILLGLANNGGVGGGGLIIPICIAMFGFSTI